MTDAPNDLDEARERVRRLLDPYRDRTDLTDEQEAKLQGVRNALAVIGGTDVDERPGHDDGLETPMMDDFVRENQDANDL
jgi:hypothetical protein